MIQFRIFKNQLSITNIKLRNLHERFGGFGGHLGFLDCHLGFFNKKMLKINFLQKTHKIMHSHIRLGLHLETASIIQTGKNVIDGVVPE